MATSSRTRIALAVAEPISWVVRLFGPVLMAIETIVRWILSCVGIRVGEDQPMALVVLDARPVLAHERLDLDGVE